MTDQTENESTEIQSGPTDSEIIAKCATVPVRFLDGTSGTTKIRLLRIREYPVMPDPIHSEIQFIANLCETDVEWLDRLHPQSYTLLVKEARRLNESFFQHCARRMQAMSDIPVALMEKLMANAARSR